MVIEATRGMVAPEKRLEESRRWKALTERVAHRREACLQSAPHIEIALLRLYTQAWRESEGEPFVIRQARAMRKIFEEGPIAIHDGELIVGSQTGHVRGGWPTAWHDARDLLKQLEGERFTTSANSKWNEVELTLEERAELRELCEYWKDRCMAAEVERVMESLGLTQDMADYNEGRFADLVARPAGMRSSNYGKLLTRGLGSLVAEARERMLALDWAQPDSLEQQTFYRACIIVGEGVIALGRRYAALARRMAAREASPQRRKELEEIAERCSWVPEHPARDFRDALQSQWFALLVESLEDNSAAVSPGRVDQFWYQYYAQDLAAGKLTRNEAAELVGLFIVKLNEEVIISNIGTKMNSATNLAEYFTIAGQTPDGGDACNELTFLVLQAVGELRMSMPLVAFRYHATVQHDAVIKALETVEKVHGGIPIFVSDLKKERDLLRAGVSAVDARDWVIVGCIEATVPSGAGGITAEPQMSVAKPFELVLLNGAESRTGKKLGPETGDPRTFKAFEEFYQAWLRQFEYAVEKSCHIANIHWAIISRHFTRTFTSLLVEDCLARGKGYMTGGARYPQLAKIPNLPSGHVDVSDSLMAIKHVVFDTKQLSMDEVLEACKANFQGPKHERVRQALLAAPKYGNDENEPDAMLDRVVRDTGHIVLKQPNAYDWFRPGAVGIGCPGVSWHYYLGATVAALPNGRYAWTPLSDGTLSPAAGVDKKGPTAVFNSAAKVGIDTRWGVVLNQKFPPRAVASREAKEKLASLLTTYFLHGGFNLQLNILDKETMVQAQKNPAQYRDLVVRVAGYSAYFVELPREVQDEIISRTWQSL